MTIGEILPQFSNISIEPKVPLSMGRLSYDQRQLVVLDANGIIGPDGKTINTTSYATDAPTHDANKLVATFDTGFTLPQVPRYVPSLLI